MTRSSTAPSTRYGVPCEKCGAGVDDPCRTLVTRRVTDTHVSRIRAAIRETQAARAALQERFRHQCETAPLRVGVSIREQLEEDLDRGE